METILATAFGRKINIQGGEADELTRVANAFFTRTEEGQLTSRDMLIMLTSECLSSPSLSFSLTLFVIALYKLCR